MKNKTPARSNIVALKQILNHIPLGMIHRHARETGVAGKVRTFSVLSHLTAMLFAQLSPAIGLNGVCDKAYVDFEHLFDLGLREVWWVTRAKDNMKYRVVKNLTKGHKDVIKDQIGPPRPRCGMAVWSYHFLHLGRSAEIGAVDV